MQRIPDYTRTQLDVAEVPEDRALQSTTSKSGILIVFL